MQVEAMSMLQAIRVTAVDGADPVGWTVDAVGDWSARSDRDVAAEFAYERSVRVEQHGDQVYLAIPCATSEALRGVVEMTFQLPPEAIAAFEIWKRNDREELKLEQGIYRSLDYIERITPFVRFPRRSGLPGDVWENRLAGCVNNLGASPNFMRSAGARSAGLDFGLCLPFMKTEHELASVLLVMGSYQLPLVSEVEIWLLDQEGTGLERKHRIAMEGAAETPTKMRLGEGAAGYAAAARIPKLFKSEDDASPAWQVAFPQFVGNRLSSVVSVSL
ncbi:hypothetical protein LOC68_01375 [Blastopirellula sp. JC732]|uniref:Uncharacterized protein n=1 Tax=Blastopirellula sediminis TaxID=2894196 RepID=A0A9X1MIZ4_9BACT|nr:hypothetical protein [Blastopirellula sediminis]MCC9608162.1 hypothetical protein [Blastopirellula sediminis]MCC9627045.1 hypothetical protein [Blastopirellula sediminis]